VAAITVTEPTLSSEMLLLLLLLLLLLMLHGIIDTWFRYRTWPKLTFCVGLLRPMIL